MKGAGFCLLYQGFYYKEVYYIEPRVYIKILYYLSIVYPKILLMMNTLKVTFTRVKL